MLARKQNFVNRILFGSHDRNINFDNFDFTTITISIFLAFFGILMVSSISFNELTSRHTFNLMVGIVLFFFIFRFEMSTWRKIDLYLIFLSLFLLLILLVPNVAPEINGAKRWIRFLGFSFQPAELAKLSLLIYVSSFCIRKKEEFKTNWRGFWKPIFIMVSLISLILLQPDLGSSAIIFLVTLTIMFIAGAPIVHFIAISMIGLFTFILMIFLVPWRFQRILTFINPWESAQDGGYQLTRSFSAIGRGDWFGAGYGESWLKLNLLPDAQTDFVFSIILEEFGSFFGIILIFIFLVLVIRCFMIGRLARQMNQMFNSFIAYGIGTLIGLHVFINIGVSIGLLPTKGLTLPFLSYGGSNLFLTFILISLIQRIYFELNESDRHKVISRRKNF
ncbi:MAG: FtsW/RodA/SpoVE family cell cycle protein [Gammaproteobacteria bacterium]